MQWKHQCRFRDTYTFTSLIIHTLILETHLQVSVLTSLSMHLEMMLYIYILITHTHIEIANRFVTKQLKVNKVLKV